MGLFYKLFSPSQDAARAKALFRKVLEDSKRPQGVIKMAEYGAELRSQFVALIKEVESDVGGLAVGIVGAEGAIMVHPKLMEEIRKRDAIFETALRHCFITKDERRKWNEGWPSVVAHYRGKNNSETVLGEKGQALALYVIYNLDAAEMAEGDTCDEQDCIVRVEEAALWHRLLDELAFRLLQGQRDFFMDILRDHLVFNLALMGSPPDLIHETMALRSRKYAEYRQWVPAEDADAEGTLLWEASKYVGAPIFLNTNPAFLLQFGNRLLEKLNAALIPELLVAKSIA